MRFRTLRSYVEAERDGAGRWVITDHHGSYPAGDRAFHAIFEPVPDDDLDDYGSREYREHAIRAVVAAQWAVAIATMEDGESGALTPDGEFIDRTSGAFIIRAIAALPCAVDLVEGNT